MTYRGNHSVNGTIIVAAGGTGGHVFPALCIARELKKDGYKIIFTTDKRGIRYLHEFKDSAIVQNIDTSSRIRLYISLLINIVLSIVKLFKLGPKMVIGFGGYPSVPAVAAAQVLFIKNIIHEQNAVMGKANKLLSILTDKIITSFEDTKGLKDSNKIIYIGNPTRFENANVPTIHETGDAFTILLFGGSQGAKIFSKEFVDAICDLSKNRTISVFHQCRESDLAKVKNSYDKFAINNNVSAFFENIDELYEKADLIISRSGASSIFEIIGFQKPSILVPYKGSINGDQEANANFLEKKNAAIVLDEKNISVDYLRTTIENIMLNKDLAAKLSENLGLLQRKGVTKKFAEVIRESVYN